MMLLLPAAAFAASTLSFFSGFGLGTLLMPLFALFFPVDQAVALTAAVHFLNAVFKLALVGKFGDLRIVIRFGLPAAAGALAGAFCLRFFTGLEPFVRYDFLGREAQVSVLKLLMAGLIAFFAVFEKGRKPAGSGPKSLAAGGLLSGFFGGLSGHQGAFRSAFLMDRGLSKEAFIGTNTAIAFGVDAVRLAVYSGRFRPALRAPIAPLLLTAAAAAWLGAWTGRRLLDKVSMQGVRRVVIWMLFFIAAGLAAGVF